jgi:ribonuclease HI
MTIRADHPLVAVYADESCLGNGREGNNPGGAGALVEFLRPRADDELVRRDLWISEPATTNNRMALRSVIESFHALSAKGRALRVVFTSDSRYLIDGMRDWVHGWAARGWTRKTGPIENLELWHDAIRAVSGHAVEWRWVRGHTGHPQNEYANHLATRAAADLSTSGGLIESAFNEWLEAQRARGRMAAELAPFPAADAFRAGRPMPRV